MKTDTSELDHGVMTDTIFVDNRLRFDLDFVFDFVLDLDVGFDLDLDLDRDRAGLGLVLGANVKGLAMISLVVAKLFAICLSIEVEIGVSNSLATS